jgi:hypothetical protein
VARDDKPDARERQAGRSGVAERFAVPLKPVTPVEGRDLSSRRTQDAVRDLEIGQPINSEECSETADGVAAQFCNTIPRKRQKSCGNATSRDGPEADMVLAKDGICVSPVKNKG